MSTTSYIIIGILVPLIVYVAVKIKKYLAKNRAFLENEYKQKQMVKEHGIPAMGKILSCDQLNESSGVVRLILTVEIIKEGEAPYILVSGNPNYQRPPFNSFKFLVKDVHQVHVGAVLPVKVHPTEPNRFAFDLGL